MKVTPTITATLDPKLIAEIASEAVDAEFLAGTQELQYVVTGVAPKLRGNRNYDVKQVAVEALTKAGIKHPREDGLVIRSRSKLKVASGADTGRLTVTLYWGKKVEQNS